MIRFFVVIFFMLIVACGPQSNVHQVNNSNRKTEVKRKSADKIRNTNIVKMRKANGVFYIPIKLNGTDMEVIFDTGASDIVISSIEASFLLRQGKLKEEDIIGETNFQIADGSISTGVRINLNKVQIGNHCLHNVEATVVDNIDAPLLLGQSALERFGSLRIDYKAGVIEFSK